MRTVLRLLAFPVLVFAASACADDGQDGTPSSASPSAAASLTPLPVPGAFFGTPSGAAGRLIEGTRCWGGACVDMVGPVTLADPIEVRPGESVDILVEGVQPAEATHAWLDVDGIQPQPGAPGQVAWVLPQPAGSPGLDITTPGEPGAYVLTVFARWSGGSDITFAAYLRVI